MASGCAGTCRSQPGASKKAFLPLALLPSCKEQGRVAGQLLQTSLPVAVSVQGGLRATRPAAVLEDLATPSERLALQLMTARPGSPGPFQGFLCGYWRHKNRISRAFFCLRCAPGTTRRSHRRSPDLGPGLTEARVVRRWSDRAPGAARDRRRWRSLRPSRSPAGSVRSVVTSPAFSRGTPLHPPARVPAPR